MINQRMAELTVGCLLLAGVASLAVLAIQVSGLTSYVADEGYALRAQFDNVGDLKPRAPVSIAGVRVGQVHKIELDPQNYRATVHLFIQGATGTLPIDTSAYIFTEGLLGSNYVSLTPGFGASGEMLQSGDLIETTYSALILEDLVGKVLFKINNSKAEE